MNQNRSQINTKVLVLLLGGIFFAVLLGFYMKTNRFYSKIYTGGGLFGLHKQEPKTTYNILLMGYGGGRHEGTYLTDSMMIAHVDTLTKKILLISLPRDIWVPVPTRNKKEDFHAKVNSVYQMGLSPRNYPSIEPKYQSVQGAAELLKTVLKKVTGLTIDNYIAVDFAGFVKAVDLIGGVSVTVDKSFDDYKYPIDGSENDPCGLTGEELAKAEKEATKEPELLFPCRYEHLHFSAGKQDMNGESGLKYVRSRQSAEDGGDFSRARRQQLFLEAVRQKVLNIGIVTKVSPLMDELENNIRTDISPDLTKQFVSEADNAGEYTLSHLVLSTNNYLVESYSSDRQYILIPKLGEDRFMNVRAGISESILGIFPTPKKLKSN